MSTFSTDPHGFPDISDPRKNRSARGKDADEKDQRDENSCEWPYRKKFGLTTLR